MQATTGSTRSTAAPSRAADGQCPRCGLRGLHASADDCIDALRSKIAEMEFAKDAAREARGPRPGRPSKRGGLRNRKDGRTVILDGDQVSLAEAARRLGMHAGTLYHQIARSTGNPKAQDVDLGSIGVDVAARGGSQPQQASGGGQ
jgi:hypothetical protein